ncbi:MAG: sugar phosphate isomerase/epimerase [Promethearchaeota archaeon]|nr:MAG: sugar phosphate isomerase/epimerase [Candidatus Lokiarchaeota archaeon]
MKLGISSLGHLVDIALRGKFKSLGELLIESTEKALKFAEKYNVGIVEIILDPPEIYSKENRQRFIDICNSYSVTKQVHAPFTDVSLCSFNINISKATVKSCIDAAEICDKIDAEILVVHPGVGHFLLSSIREQNKKQLIRAVNELLDATSEFDVLICIENMPQDAHMLGNENDIGEFLSSLNRDDIYLTLDTSHAWTCDMNLEIYWERFHKYVRNIHLADNENKETDRHPALGTGKVNFNEMFKLAKKYNYKGPLIVEIITGRALRRSIEFIEPFLK